MLEKDWQDLKLMHQAPFLLVKNLSNTISAKVGDMLSVCPLHFNYMRGGMAGKGILLPKNRTLRKHRLQPQKGSNNNKSGEDG